jgi:DNA-binding SARP family transcriptional activator
VARPRPLLHPRSPRATSAGPLPTHDASGRPLLRLQTLGAASILIGDLRLGTAAGTLFSLLLRLVGTPGLQVSAESLRASLWPDQTDVRQRANLRQALYKLRGYGLRISHATGMVVLDETQLVRTFSVERSAECFARDVTHGVEPFGPYVPGFTVPWPALQEWIDEQRELVHADVRRVLSEQLRQRRDRADWGGAGALARWMLQFDPLNEEATLTIAECTALSGSKKEALAVLDRYLDELGPLAGDIRLPAAMLRRRIAEPLARGRLSFAPTERHFVGRETELSELTLAMRRARWHDGSAILLHGPPGIGKSRLAHELEKVACIEGVRVMQASCRESDLLRPLSVFLDLLPELMHQPGALGCAPESLAALRRLLPFDRSAASPVSPDASLERPSAAMRSSTSPGSMGLGDGAGELPVIAREPMPMAASLRRAIIDLMAAVADERPLLLIVEDVHWIDEHSWDVLADLIDRLHALRVFVLLTSREAHARPQRPQRSPIGLRVRVVPPLSPESSLALSRAIGDDLSAPVSDELGAWFVRASEGIPLFLRALVNHWIETGEAGGVPPTLQGVIEQRLSQLSGDALRVMQTAALLGKWATVERVGRVLELSIAGQIDAISELEINGMIVHGTTPNFMCHELVSKEALTSLPRLCGGLLHARIAIVLQGEVELSANEALLLPVLTHWKQAGDTSSLVQFAATILRCRTRLHNPTEVLRFLESVSSGTISTFEANTLGVVCSVLRVESGRYREELDSRREGAQLPATDERLSTFDAERALSLIDSAYRSEVAADVDWLADYAASVSLLRHLTPPVRIRAASIGLVIATNQCDIARVQRIWQTASADPDISHPSDDWSRIELLFHTLFGDRDRSISIANDMLEKARQGHLSLSSVTDAMRSAFALRVASGDGSHFEAFTFAFDAASKLGLSLPAMTCAWQLAQSSLENGRTAQYRSWLELLLRLHRAEPDRVSTNFATALYCRGAIEQGDVDEARRLYADFVADLPKRPTVRAASHAYALRIAVELLDEEWKASSGQLSELLRYFETVSRFGTADFLVSVTVQAQTRVDTHKARTTLRRYFREFRREVCAPSGRLQGAAAACSFELAP